MGARLRRGGVFRGPYPDRGFLVGRTVVHRIRQRAGVDQQRRQHGPAGLRLLVRTHPPEQTSVAEGDRTDPILTRQTKKGPLIGLPLKICNSLSNRAVAFFYIGGGNEKTTVHFQLIA